MRVGSYATTTYMHLSIYLILAELLCYAHGFHSCSGTLTATRVSSNAVLDAKTMGIKLTYPNSPEIQWPTGFWPPDWVLSMTNGPFRGMPTDATAVVTWGRHKGTQMYWGWQKNTDNITWPSSTRTYPNSYGGILKVLWKNGASTYAALNFGGGGGLNHMSSPDFHFDSTTSSVYMFFHVAGLSTKYVPVNFDGTTYDPCSQATVVAKWEAGQKAFIIQEKAGAAITSDNIRALNAAVAPYYFRHFKYNGVFYGLGKNSEPNSAALLMKSENPSSVLGPYKVVKMVLNRARHTGVYVQGSELSVGFSNIYQAITPEIALMVNVDMSPADPKSWDFGGTQTFLLDPQLWWEGANRPVTQPFGGSCPSLEKHIRDPTPYIDRSGKARLLYMGGGEYAIGQANLACT